MERTNDRNVGDLLMENLTAIDDERQEKCIHCNKQWYSKHYRDGVCHSCQQKNLPGRTALERRENIQSKVAWVVGILAQACNSIGPHKLLRRSDTCRASTPIGGCTRTP